MTIISLVVAMARNRVIGLNNAMPWHIPEELQHFKTVTMGKPMIIVKPLPGQEANNTRYLTEKGAAIKVDRPKEINLIVEELIGNAHKLNQIKDAVKKIAKPSASIDIARLVLGK
mgnify:CR=1 FL=1